MNALKQTPNVVTHNYALYKAISKDNASQILSDPIQQPDLRDTPTTATFLDDLELKWIDDLVQTQKYTIEKYGKGLSNKVLLILDDSISSKTIKSPSFRKFLLNSRHYNISVIFVSQSYMLLDRTIRINNSFLSILEVANLTNLRQIYEENSAGLDWATWKDVYDTCISKDYGFFSISYQNDKKHRLICNFEEFLIVE